jgi:hypothetical protein
MPGAVAELVDPGRGLSPGLRARDGRDLSPGTAVSSSAAKVTCRAARPRSTESPRSTAGSDSGSRGRPVRGPEPGFGSRPGVLWPRGPGSRRSRVPQGLLSTTGASRCGPAGRRFRTDGPAGGRTTGAAAPAMAPTEVGLALPARDSAVARSPSPHRRRRGEQRVSSRTRGVGGCRPGAGWPTGARGRPSLRRTARGMPPPCRQGAASRPHHPEAGQVPASTVGVRGRRSRRARRCGRR